VSENTSKRLDSQVLTVEPTIVGDFTISVLDFTYSAKPGSTFKGTAKIAITNLIPGHTLKLAKVGYFAPSDPQDPDDRGRTKFNNYKDDNDEWQPAVEFYGQTPEDKQLHYRILGRARKAIEIYLAQHSNNGVTAAFDELPQNVPISDEEIPF
jgi:hypothetical protein